MVLNWPTASVLIVALIVAGFALAAFAAHYNNRRPK